MDGSGDLIRPGLSLNRDKLSPVAENLWLLAIFFVEMVQVLSCRTHE
jgi:hypothetical protein